MVRIHNIRSNQDHPLASGGLASHSIQRNHSVEIKHYKELGDFGLQWLMPLNLAVFKSVVFAIISTAMLSFVCQKVCSSFSSKPSYSFR